jgi:hypothetical protein
VRVARCKHGLDRLGGLLCGDDIVWRAGEVLHAGGEDAGRAEHAGGQDAERHDRFEQREAAF